MISVAILHSVTEIGRDAFHGCSALASMAGPESVTQIGDQAFSGCSALPANMVFELDAWYGQSIFDAWG